MSARDGSNPASGAFTFMGRRNQRKIQLVAPPPQSSTIDGAREYVAGSGISFAQSGTVLTPERRDRENVGADIYRRMLHDPEVDANVWLLVDAALADGIEIHPKELTTDDARQELANEIADSFRRTLDGLEKPIADTCKSLLKNALQYGHKIAEQTYYVIETGPDAGRIGLKSIKLKQRKSLAFVVDKFWNVLGLQSLMGDTQTVLPRSKFVILTLREEDEDPRGNSWLRSSVNAWSFKCGTWPTYDRFMKRVAVPSLVGKTAPGAKPQVVKNSAGEVQTDGAGNPLVLQPTDAMLAALVNFENSTALAIPAEAEVDALEVQSKGEVFDGAFTITNNEITRGMLFQTRATNEAQHGSKADSQTGETILERLIWYLKGKVAAMLTSDVAKPWLILNFGEENLDLLPEIALGDTDRKDWATDGAAVVALAPLITDSQWNALTMQLGIPAPLEGEQLPSRAKVAPTMPGDEKPGGEKQ